MRHLTAHTFAPLAAGLCLMLSACGGGGGAEAFDPAGVAKALQDSGAFEQPLAEMEKDQVCQALYHIDEGSLNEYAVYTSLTAGAEEIAVLVLADGDAAETAYTALEQRVADQRAALESYLPQEVGKLDNAILERRGNSVLLVVANDAAAAQSALDKAGK
ncbi:DUF4358 domain-containing protein [Pseudoflavonifractor sp. 524-17]|uniref:DUF4358 domain-containing protein n=1 Tax=Pseudoflavonifractor sp. 524-17 TaxID=2304577 RepID=UPI0013794CCD|nr:DUF4358 domain-containing protein [Pseudoflavonifractor sp. 524-17]NCE64157.1 DUF4358 domain-containing protein [Pseudoflavonifractor sp. 524-17]